NRMIEMKGLKNFSLVIGGMLVAILGSGMATLVIAHGGDTTGSTPTKEEARRGSLLSRDGEWDRLPLPTWSYMTLSWYLRKVEGGESEL
ncbi:MAG: hypothetical protein ABIO92_04950, partial [Chloroflexia bacterium]